MSPSDVASPGGWLNLQNTRIGRAIVIGAVATALGGGVSAIYGMSQGAQAAWYCEGQLVSATKDTVSYSCLNPLPTDMSGAVLPTIDNLIYINGDTAPKTRLNIGTASTSTEAIASTVGSANVASGIVLETKRTVSLLLTGSLVSPTSHGTPLVVLAPRNSNGEKYLNFTLTRGTGALVNGEPAAFARIQIVPCNVDGVGC